MDDADSSVHSDFPILWRLWKMGVTKTKNRLSKLHRESYVCYGLFIALFVWNCTLLTLPYPLSMFYYALIGVSPSRHYWQLVLIYTEMYIIAQYCF